MDSVSLIRTKSTSMSQVRRFNLNKRQILRIIVALMSLNILISLLILHQKSKITFVFDVKYQSTSGNNNNNNNNDLLVSLNTIRSIYDGKLPIKANLNTMIAQTTSKSNHQQEQKMTDYLFNKNSFSNLINKPTFSSSTLSSSSSFSSSKWPKILINNQNACKLNDTVFILCMIHSHRNNYLRRQAMRDTWLKFNKFNLHDDLNLSLNLTKQNYEMIHLFVIGNDQQNNSTTAATSNDIIKQEADNYNDIIMIDTIDTYQNLFYKHLTVINWIMDNCQNATYVIKLDDDVFVNIKKLTRHLIDKFGMDSNNNSKQNEQSKFLYCNVNDMALPIRKNSSKWYVDYDTYGFDYYPKYCEGFSYITNIATLKLMHSQTKIIPRFWIDDVYFTGILLYGFDQIKWYDFKQESLKWSYYDFWDLGNTLNIYELYASFLKLFNINAIDFYKMDYFVILHVQENKQVNYNQLNGSDSYKLSRQFLSSIKNQTKNHNNNSLILNTNNNYNKCSYLNNKFKSLLASFNNDNLTKDDCEGLEKKFFEFHFYKFCLNLWNQVK